MSLDSYIEEKRALVDAELDRRLPKEDERPAELHSAMRYAVFSGGKRIRPLLCFAAAEIVEGISNDTRIAAAAIEAFHTYTLIHDDLPAMDDDDMRRGRPSCHVQFGESTAILAGDALIAASFEWLGDVDSSMSAHMVRELAQCGGSRGIVGGQMEDLSWGDVVPDSDSLEYVYMRKTAYLLKTSVCLGGMSAGASEDRMRALRVYGEHLGLAFQYTDDLLDESSDDKATSLDVYGRERVQQRVQEHIAQATDVAHAMHGDSSTLVALADMVYNRKE